jgi:hypothetical protein
MHFSFPPSPSSSKAFTKVHPNNLDEQIPVTFCRHLKLGATYQERKVVPRHLLVDVTFAGHTRKPWESHFSLSNVGCRTTPGLLGRLFSLFSHGFPYVLSFLHSTSLMSDRNLVLVCLSLRIQRADRLSIRIIYDW